MREFRLTSRCKGHLHSSEMLCSVCWCLDADILVQSIRPIFKFQAVLVHSCTAFPLRMEPIDCPEISVKTTKLCWVKSQKNADINYKSTLHYIQEERKSLLLQ